MFKKMSLLVLGVLVVGFCVTIPEGRVDAASIKCSGKHKHKKESGTASCKGWYLGGNASKSFKTTSSGTYRDVRLPNLPTDWYTVKVKGKCGASNSKDVYASGVTTPITINY